MPGKLLYDLTRIDPDNVCMKIEEIRRYNPQRHEMEQLTALVHVDQDARTLIGRRDVKTDEFWVRGHIPGRPLMPGVLMIETAAQLCALGFKLLGDPKDERFVGFAGVTDVKFRGAVSPGETMLVIATAVEMRSRRAIFRTQEVVDGRLVFEGTIIGMPV